MGHRGPSLARTGGFGRGRCQLALQHALAGCGDGAAARGVGYDHGAAQAAVGLATASATQLADKAHAINTAGKALGKIVLNTTSNGGQDNIVVDNYFQTATDGSARNARTSSRSAAHVRTRVNGYGRFSGKVVTE